jgi:hypothetical protein
MSRIPQTLQCPKEGVLVCASEFMVLGMPNTMDRFVLPNRREVLFVN